MRNKLYCLYKGPGWIPGTEDDSYPIPPCTRTSVQKYHPVLSITTHLCLLLEYTAIIWTLNGSMTDLSAQSTIWSSGGPARDYFLVLAQMVWCVIGVCCVSSMTNRTGASNKWNFIICWTGIALICWRDAWPSLFSEVLLVDMFMGIIDFQKAGNVVCGLLLLVSSTTTLLSSGEFSKPLTEEEIAKDMPWAETAEQEELQCWKERQKTKVR